MPSTDYRCEVCGRGPANGVPVFRFNPTETPPIYRCEEHRKLPAGYPAVQPDDEGG